jgi:hypothetical protein
MNSNFGCGLRSALSVLPLAVLCSGCAHAPLVDVGGSLLPAWMLCLLLGALSGFAAQGVVERRGWRRRISPAVLFYPGVALSVACLLWLLLFR